MRWEQKVEYATLTDIGFRRKNNQDSCSVLMAADAEHFFSRGHVFLVADGMGGHAVGELASKIAADTIPHAFNKLVDLPPGEALRRAIEEANATIFNRAEKNPEFQSMGTTCTTLVLSPAGVLAGHVGDSRLYRIRDGRIDQLTFDHSLQWELVRQGRAKLEEVELYEPRNVITRSLGPERTVTVDVEGPYPVLAGDVYLLCSDGLCGVLNDEEIGIVAGELAPAEACRLLVNLANLRGGPDNITVAIVRIGAPPPGLEEPPPPPVHTEISGWEWLLGLWGLGLLFVVSMWLFLWEKLVEGVLSLAGVVLVAGGMLLAWLRVRRTRPPRDAASTTVIWRPYRSASARLTRKFLGQIAALENMLQQMAVDESWDLDWPAHQTAFNAAKNAAARMDDRAALKEYAQAVQILMSSVQQQRRRLERAAKWSVKNMPSRSATEP